LPAPAQIERVHATCVVLGSVAALIRGPSGSGKSDLALRFLHLPSSALGEQPLLVADDLLEVRGIGIVKVSHARSATVGLVVDLVPAGVQGAPIERFPDPLPQTQILDIPVALLRISGFEASAASKLALALTMGRR
jgi:HPr kinase/phosphorylase